MTVKKDFPLEKIGKRDVFKVYTYTRGQQTRIEKEGYVI